jgi:hypothetical protein
MTCRPRPCCTSDGPMDRELASPAAPASALRLRLAVSVPQACERGCCCCLCCPDLLRLLVRWACYVQLKDDVLAQ